MIKTIVFLLLALFITQTTAATCRKQSVKHRFDVSQGYPHGRPGYIVDHICALAGKPPYWGIDSVTNMQYQTIEDSRIKDKEELTSKGKLKYCTPYNSLSYRTIYNCK